MVQQVIVVTKPSNLEISGEVSSLALEAGRISEKTLEKLVHSHDEHYETLKLLKELFKKHEIKAHFFDRERFANTLMLPEFKEAKAIWTFGGDGTLLSTVQHLGPLLPIVGVRSSLDSVGHLCIADHKNLEEIVELFVKESLDFHDCPRLLAKVDRLSEPGFESLTKPFMNDALYTASNPAATTRYELQLGETIERQKSSGIWIATPTGSTAGIFAAGGEKQSFDSNKNQFLVREYFNPKGRHSDLLHGFLNLDQEVFSIVNLTDAAILALDGHLGLTELKYGDKISFAKGPSLRLAKPRHWEKV